MLNIVILAAGQGKRMQSDLPKVLHPIAGQPMISHVVATSRQLQPDRIVVVVGHGAAQVKAVLDPEDNLSFVTQAQQLGTGHAVQQALPHLVQTEGSTTIVLYGDVPLVQAQTLVRLREATPSGGLAILTEQLENPQGYGRILRNDQDAIVGIVEEKDATPEQQRITEVNTGLMAVDSRNLQRWLAAISNQNAQNEYYLTDIIALAAADGVAVQATQPQAPWETLGVNSRRQQATLERLWQREQGYRLMDQGVTLADPERLDIRGNLRCGTDVFIDVGCVFEGDVTLGDGVVIGPHCLMRDAQILSGAHIKAFSHIEGAVVGEQASIGPYARLRPGTQLAPSVHIGNFVEVKNSAIGQASKANHLAYIGDAAIGKRVNIGAGTITCNYDGANKHQTIIEDDVFIGSDSQLVAPVTIEQGATIGAGTTLTKNAPQGRLTLSRSEQKTIFGWTRPKRP